MALSGNLSSNSKGRTDLVAYWSVPLVDGVHTVEFEHGTTSGKRVIRVDGKEILRREWMFKLVGEERFYLGKQRTLCELHVDPLSNFMFGYYLMVEGKTYEKFVEKQSKMLMSWAVVYNNKKYRIVLDKRTLEVFANGKLVETDNEFVAGGTEMRFILDQNTLNAVLKSTSTSKLDGIVYELYMNEKFIAEDDLYRF